MTPDVEAATRAATDTLDQICVETFAAHLTSGTLTPADVLHGIAAYVARTYGSPNEASTQEFPQVEAAE